MRKEKAEIVVNYADEDSIKGYVYLRHRKIEIPFEADTTKRTIDIDLHVPGKLEGWGQDKRIKIMIRNLCGKINVPHKEVTEVYW